MLGTQNPAYSQGGNILSRVFQGSTDGDVFEDFIDNVEASFASDWITSH
jgi:hypothetical protein